MKTIIKIFATGLMLVLACSKENSSSQEKGFATGKVVDANGNPITGAKILLDNTMFYASYIHGSTDKNGTYKIKAQEGAWRTFAYIDKVYNGQTYTMELFPDKTDAFSAEGAVRNFVWKLEGRMPWEAENYYGGVVQLTSDLDFTGDIEDVELVFTPKGPLIDGSAGQALTFRYGDAKWKNRYELWDIPIGRYTVTATLKTASGKQPLKIQDWYTRGSFSSNYQLDFIPKPSSGVNNSASIVIGD